MIGSGLGLLLVRRVAEGEAPPPSGGAGEPTGFLFLLMLQKAS
jgi:hypothetical protein